MDVNNYKYLATFRASQPSDQERLGVISKTFIVARNEKMLA